VQICLAHIEGRRTTFFEAFEKRLAVLGPFTKGLWHLKLVFISSVGLPQVFVFKVLPEVTADVMSDHGNYS